MPEKLLSGLHVNFENAERVPLGIDEVTLPAGFRYGELRQGDNPAATQNYFRRCIEIFHLKRANECVRP